MENQVEIVIQTDPISLLIACLTLLITLSTLLLSIRSFIMEKRRVRPVFWQVNNWGVMHDAFRGKDAYGVRLENSGTGTALLHTVFGFECVIVPPGEEPIKSWSFGPGECVDVAVLAPEPDKAWILLLTTPAHDRRKTMFEWFPVMSDSPLSEQWTESLERSEPPKWWKWQQKGGEARKVGPGGYVDATVRRNRVQQPSGRTARDIQLERSAESTGHLAPHRAAVNLDFLSRCPDQIVHPKDIDNFVQSPLDA